MHFLFFFRNPGSKKDDEVMYGSGQSGDPVHAGNSRMEHVNPGSGQGKLSIPAEYWQICLRQTQVATSAVIVPPDMILCPHQAILLG